MNMYYRAPGKSFGRKQAGAAASDAGSFQAGPMDRVFSMWKPSAPDQPPPARRIGAILRERGPSGILAAEARILVRMERTVHRVLGGESVAHVRAAGVSSDTIRLLADSPAWASIARFKVREICAALRSEAPRIRRARVTVMETEIRTEPPAAGAATPISPAAARVLRSAARSMDNPRLARILVKLAARERSPAGHEFREREAVTRAQSAATGRP